MKLPSRDSVRAIGVEIDRLRQGGAGSVKIEAYERWRDRTVDFLFADNKLRHARQAGRSTTVLRMAWFRALVFCLWARIAASLHGE